jgi:hypothetical protein
VSNSCFLHVPFQVANSKLVPEKLFSIQSGMQVSTVVSISDPSEVTSRGLWLVTPSSGVAGDHSFGGLWCLHLHDFTTQKTKT